MTVMPHGVEPVIVVATETGACPRCHGYMVQYRSIAARWSVWNVVSRRAVAEGQKVDVGTQQGHGVKPCGRT